MRMWEKMLGAAMDFENEKEARVARDKVAMYERQHGRGAATHALLVLDQAMAEQRLVEREIQK